MTWKHTPSQEAGLGLLVSFIETTLPITQGTMLKISLLHLTWGEKKKKILCSFHIDFFAINTQNKITMEMQQFLPLTPQYKISVNIE